MLMEDLINRNMVEEKEPLIVASLPKLRELCVEFGITNQCMIGNQFSAIITFLNKYKAGDESAMENVLRMFNEAKEDKGVTYL